MDRSRVDTEHAAQTCPPSAPPPDDVEHALVLAVARVAANCARTLTAGPASSVTAQDLVARSHLRGPHFGKLPIGGISARARATDPLRTGQLTRSSGECPSSNLGPSALSHPRCRYGTLMLPSFTVTGS
ncbi:hypothetical protein PUNSTDRAFT_136797 [Punctularia strigosozonata HHB-11173 SS5]|uniref:uncharacterized protein n=1 Tax=Punctularia strigosozonata (strain HHB-11173) TaxID=741275 RepID=UPI00044167D8|nr:uncharacterized protein PUNSTDRAFT_136797 [Punctularia strigosozonata HHB-11173 SS5]EIN06000.1 hypothetical protein PUNSTDRAFT_136797 [Punctularia strigosozonata HHB-11173 SS5]